MKKLIKLLSNPYMLTVIPMMVITVGLFLSITGYDTAFQRSGAVLVVLAIIAVYVNHFIEKEINFTESSLKRSEKYDTKEKAGALTETMIARQNAMVDKNNPKITYSEIMVDIDKVSDELYESHKETKKALPILKTAKSNTVNLEFLTGLVGTVIWAFGDLPFTCVV